MQEPSAGRYDRMYDEHNSPPQPGIEEKIMHLLSTNGPLSPGELISSLTKQGFLDSDARDHTWSLIDRGYIGVDRHLKLEAHSEPVSID